MAEETASREGPRRLRHLAARRRRPGEPRAGAGGWLVERGHQVEAIVTADRAPAETGYPVLVRLAHAAARRPSRRGGATDRTARAARRRRLLDRDVHALVRRRRGRADAAGGEADLRSRFRARSPGRHRRWSGGRLPGTAGAARAPRCARSAISASGAPPMSSARARTWSSWRSPGARARITSRTCRTRRPRAAGAAPATLEDRPALVFAGRLTAQKDLALAFEALSAVPEAHLSIVGDGPDRVRLEQLRDELGLAERVRFLGPLPRSEALGLMRAADVVILSSAWENFPHGVVEALAVGTPVVATRVGGVPEIVVDGENGLLVEPGDAAAFGAALRRILDDDALRGGSPPGGGLRRSLFGGRDLRPARGDPRAGGGDEAACALRRACALHAAARCLARAQVVGCRPRRSTTASSRRRPIARPETRRSAATAGPRSTVRGSGSLCRFVCGARCGSSGRTRSSRRARTRRPRRSPPGPACP